MMMICVKQRTYLKGANGSRLETQIGLEILSNFTHQSLEGQLTDEQLGRLLVTTDLTKSHSTGTITMGLLYTTGGWCRFTGCLGGQLLAWSFTSSGFTSGLLGTCHFNLLRIRMLQGERNRESSLFIPLSCCKMRRTAPQQRWCATDAIVATVAQMKASGAEQRAIGLAAAPKCEG